jgi:hypothetical protein
MRDVPRPRWTRRVSWLAASVTLVGFGQGSSALAQAPAQQTPAQSPAAPGQPAQGRGGVPPAAGTAAPAAPTTAVVARSFTAPVGLVFNTVRPERVVEFERLLAEVQTALARSKNPTTQAQAKGWRFYKASEAGPGGAVMFVFVIDPVVAGEDYSLGKVLVEAFPDPMKLQEIWALYTGSVTGGGSLLNLTPVSATVVPPKGTATPAAGPPVTPVPDPAAAPAAPRTPPPDSDPSRNPLR